MVEPNHPSSTPSDTLKESRKGLDNFFNYMGDCLQKEQAALDKFKSDIDQMRLVSQNEIEKLKLEFQKAQSEMRSLDEFQKIKNDIDKMKGEMDAKIVAGIEKGKADIKSEINNTHMRTIESNVRATEASVRKASEEGNNIQKKLDEFKSSFISEVNNRINSIAAALSAESSRIGAMGHELNAVKEKLSQAGKIFSS